MKPFVCLHCFNNNFEKSLAKLAKPPLESLINYDANLQRFSKEFNGELFDQWMELNIQEDEFDEYIKKLSIEDDGTGFLRNSEKMPKCSKCREPIFYEDYIVEEEDLNNFLIEVCNILAEDISKHIGFCSNCHIIKDFNEYNQILKEETGIVSEVKGKEPADFLLTFEFPVEYHEIIYPYLKCNHCETRFGERIKVDNERIYDFDDLNDYFSTDIEEMNLYAERFGINFRKVEVSNFSAFLRNNTMLGFKHSVGKRLYKLFECIFKEEEYELLENVKLYRGRTRNIGSKKFDSSQMWSPPIGVSSHGRYNLIGSSVLYLSDDKKYIPHELNYKGDQLLDIATVRINRQLKILDFSKMYGEFGRILSTSPSSTNALKLEYLLTNYIAECCRHIGFHGIKYNGVKKGDYKNIALLNYEQETDISIECITTYQPKITYSLNKHLVPSI
ncbi:hypothetical protein UP17_25395 (plasmid) [Peribacillus simplex]|uniref:RES domain-containing protein n=1 Tax=Peribacillus simplex TaxID=1478 RepID=UPI000777D252|nr:RES domain-containing protein [Peribacillus simplex]AMM95772.1 hypothetical protein UP17_25395 [Peribacillus simplex]